MLLARNGVAALCYDPIGQGERYQTFSPNQQPLGGDYQGGASSVAQLKGIPGGPKFNPVEEHTLIGIGSILVGANTATYRIWDGIRAIDYLTSRPDIDAKRIGCTGNSGGGTLTAYLMALDERIVAAAPTCYLTSFERLLATAGPQDAEQNLFGQLARGLDEADYVLMRAPRPTLLCAGTRDATFDIAGTWDILRDAKRVYVRLGYPERVDIAEADEPHGFTQPLREAATRWLVRWLRGKDEAIFEPQWKAYTAAELQCTPQGQVMFLANERSVFDFNRDEAKRLAPRRSAAWTAQSSAERIATVRRIAGIRDSASLAATVEVVATEKLTGFERRKIVLKRDDGIELPGLLYVPESPRPDAAALLYVDSQGKQAGAAAGGVCETAARGGQWVLAFDPQGLGETLTRHPRDWGRELFGPNTQEFFLAYMLGQSLVGLHAEDILTATRFLANCGEPPAPRTVSLDARGTAAQLAALHARFVEPRWFEAAGEAAYADLPRSWTELLDTPAAGDRLPLAIHAVLAAYDLADLGR
jgi:dienelactone hydrolase